MIVMLSLDSKAVALSAVVLAGLAAAAVLLEPGLPAKAVDMLGSVMRSYSDRSSVPRGHDIIYYYYLTHSDR